MFLKNFIQNLDDIIDIEATIQDAIDKMSQNKLHHIVIIENQKAVGLLTEKDVVQLFKNNIDFSSLAIKYARKNLITLHNTRLVQYALTIMLDNNIRKIIVVNSQNHYVGCIEQEEIVYRFEEELHTADTHIGKLLNSTNIASIIDENDNLQYALNIMTEQNITSLLISKNKKVIGIISESDIVHLAQQNVNHIQKVKHFMHSPIITIKTDRNVSDMIEIMKQNNIRRVVVEVENSEQYHILNSKDLINNIKGNYTQFLESKLFDTRDTFNTLSESIIELIDLDDEQVIYWTNAITKETFDINIDDNITKIIPKELWKELLEKLLEKETIFENISLQNRYFQLKGHYGTILDNKVIKLFLYDITDITNLNRELQKQNEIQRKLLFNQQKMVQMGEMIGHIAHQWRQPLSTISIAASGMQLKKKLNMLEDDEFDAFNTGIINNVEYLSKTIDTFQNFLKEKKELKEVILEERIQNILTIISTSLKNNYIELIDNIDYTQNTAINMVSGELDQVIINIMNNAKDALIENNIENPWIEISLYCEDNKILITIEDNAKGIPKECIKKIFDEYFTTKDSTKGTGLGLYMSSKIVTESLHGKLYVKNTSNGAKFFIEVPL